MIELVVYGVRFGRPENLDLDFDVRFMSNPHHDRKLRELTGLHEAVIKEVSSVHGFHARIEKMKDKVLEIDHRHSVAGKPILVGVHCTGGRHRSVVVANALAELLRVNAREVKVTYLNPVVAELARERSNADK